MNYGGFGYVADSCPRNRTEFTDSATRLNCSVYENGRSRYVCVPNIQKSAIVEFCNKNAARVFKQGNCLEVSDYGFLHPSSCQSFTEGCPSENYTTTELFKYPACHQIDSENGCYLADPSCENELMIMKTFMLGSLLILLAVSGVFICLAVVVCLLWRSARNEQERLRLEDFRLYWEEQERLRLEAEIKEILGEYDVWKTSISDQFSSLSDDEVCVLFCFLCSYSGTPNFTDTDWLNILNEIRDMYMYDENSVTSEEAQRTLDGLKSCGFLWDQDGVDITEDVKDETMYRVTERDIERDIERIERRVSLLYMYQLYSYTTAVRYLRSHRYTRKSGEKCVITDGPYFDSLLIRRLQMNTLTHVTMEDTSICDEVSQTLFTPQGIFKQSIDDREELLNKLTQSGECVQYRAGSQGSVQHVKWLWRLDHKARPDIVRSCIGLHPHCDIYIINNTAYRKHSKYHDYSTNDRIMLYCLLLADGYMLNVKEDSYQSNFNKIKERYFGENTTPDHEIREPLPDGIIKTQDDVITFVSDNIRHDVMYAFVTECLVEDSDLKFFLTTASRDVISEYCRLWDYKRSEGERCLYIPKKPDEMYELFIDRLQLDILTHCTVSDWRIHYSISERLKIPEEILEWDYDARRRYAECAKKGTQTIHRARAMIVGCAGAGKSTLLKRLQKRSLDEVKQVQSTVGLEVHEDIFEIAPESDCLKDLPADTGKEGKQLLSILDFGGQCAYYACHQVYLSRRAFYLLVLNMSKRFDEKVDPSLCEQEGTMFTDWTHGEYLLFWLKSVHTYCDNDAPVIIVGTHLDQTKEQNPNKLYNSIQDYLKHDQKMRSHLARERCFVLGFKSDGSSFQDTLSELEKCMISIAKQDKWKESIPTDWALSEVVLRNLRRQGERMIPVTEFLKECFGNIRKKYTQIRDILKFYHDIGVILHFDEGSLAETVIINIQWFVDSFKNIITDPNHVRDLVEDNRDWLEFNENGHINDSLLTNIWRSWNFEIDPRDKSNLLQYMERLGLIFIGDQTHYIPCMNKRTFAVVQEEGLQSIESKTSVLVFRFPFLPYFIYFRLIVACLTKTRGEWRFPKDEHLPLYKNLAYFVYKEHTVALAVNRCSIQLQVFQRNKNPISKNVALEIRDDIKRLLNDLTRNFHKEIMYTVGYQCSKQEVYREHDDCFVEEKEIHGKGEQTCPIHEIEKHHTVIGSNLLYYWNKDVQNKPASLSIDETNITVLSEKDLSKFNKVIGNDMELIATCLGLSQVEIDRLKRENPTSMSTVVHNILLTWKRKRGPAATLENLEKSLQDAERDTGAGVNWDVFNRAKKAILEKKEEMN
ncbi:uncharacterized protein LOC125676208 [Ostrea edulis]|uniref:uncharacterized protein LOC125676208 n=1 Tax=Ostrea edulis TaxID=37623 RepID=UPI0024AF33B8|nr:uncharacterized protein LOC125676208 [Ostrea edulis]XP_056015076.1 uncharacterized protein LOC125676208 [Ostrea edulis]